MTTTPANETTAPAPATRGSAYAWYALGLLALLAAPYFIYPLFAAKVLCYCLFACAFNLLLGTSGLLSFGHAAFFGMAAYVSGHALKVWGLPFEVAAILGTLTGAALGLIFGIASIRRQGLYFAMITLALAQMVYFLAFQMPFTHAEDGLTAVPRGKVLGLFDLNNLYVLYYTAAVVFIVGYLMIVRITYSNFGQVLKAIRENQPRMISLGYSVNTTSSSYSFCPRHSQASPAQPRRWWCSLHRPVDVHWATSGDVTLMALLGGVGTLFGPVIGAVIVESLQFYLADSGLPIPAVIGAIFVVCILLFRHGIVGEYQRLRAKWR